MSDDAERKPLPAALTPKTDQELAKELHARLSEIVGETVDLLNDQRWRHLQASFNIGRDVTGRWFVQHVLVIKP